MTNIQQKSVSRTGTRIDSKLARERALRLTSWRSETGTSGEAKFADQLHGLLSELPYFREHPEDLRLVDSHG
ncbi:MAG: peptidase M20, partial [Mesorhizobium sp.]